MEHFDKNKKQFNKPFILIPWLGAIIYFLQMNLWFIPEAQKLTGEIGGPTQTFMSIMSFPLALILGYLYSWLLLRPLFRWMLKNGCLSFINTTVVPFLILFLILHLIEFVLAGFIGEKAYDAGHFFSLSAGLINHTSIVFVAYGVFYWWSLKDINSEYISESPGATDGSPASVNGP